MKDDENLKYLVDMAQSLAEMNGKMTILCDRIEVHEARIQHLEEKQSSIPAQSDSQTSLLQMALKALLFIAATAMALAGAGKFINV